VRRFHRHHGQYTAAQPVGADQIAPPVRMAVELPNGIFGSRNSRDVPGAYCPDVLYLSNKKRRKSVIFYF